jgi:hypothetical protein
MDINNTRTVTVKDDASDLIKPAIVMTNRDSDIACKSENNDGNRRQSDNILNRQVLTPNRQIE